MPDNISENERASPPLNYLTKIIESVTAQEVQKETADTAKVSAAPQKDLLSSLLSNPELLSKLPSIISTVKPILEMLGTAQKSEAEPKIIAASLSATHEKSDEKYRDRDHRSALLCAMKPYLCKDRQDAIDYVIKLSRLGELLKTL